MTSYNISLKSTEERAAIHRDLIASQMAHNLNRGIGAQKITQRLSKMTPEQRADMQGRIDKYVAIGQAKMKPKKTTKPQSQHWYRQ